MDQTAVEVPVGEFLAFGSQRDHVVSVYKDCLWEYREPHRSTCSARRSRCGRPRRPRGWRNGSSSSSPRSNAVPERLHEYLELLLQVDPFVAFDYILQRMALVEGLECGILLDTKI